uniref:glucan 1,3-beta-glucosidase n=1 Tax=Peronospora matthiolae TaxID=2874970 RepID=A0AAV1TM26_9STRA
MATSSSLQARLRRGEIPCRGVNLGGWLVAEHWMTWDSCVWHGVPDDIKTQGEYATMKFLGHEEGDRRFDDHRRTWITESDIAEIKRFGLNVVRVPVGYWIMGYDPTDISNKQEWTVFAPYALQYLDELVNHWCVKYDVPVIVDIHAAKGSQNGRDHSAAVTSGVTYWGQYPENVDNTVHLAKFLASRYRDSPAFVGLGLLNEPEHPTDQNVLRGYYERAYAEIRATGNDCVLTVAPLLTEQRPPCMEDFMRFPQFVNVWHEWHPYFLWGYEGQKRKQVLQAIRCYGDQISSWSGNWLLIDEWSLGAQSYAFPSEDRHGLRQFASAQLEAFRKAHAGWIFWSWRHSDDGHNRPTGWSMRQLLRDGVIQLGETTGWSVKQLLRDGVNRLREV